MQEVSATVQSILSLNTIGRLTTIAKNTVAKHRDLLFYYKFLILLNYYQKVVWMIVTFEIF